MAEKGSQDQVRSNLDKQVPEKQGFLGKVKDTLNVTKHFGFVSDLDSPANQAALAAMREGKEVRGVTDAKPQAPLSDRLQEGYNTVAETAIGVSSVAAGGMLPQTEGAQERAESHVEKANLGATVDRPSANLTEAAKEMKEGSDGSAPQSSEHRSEHTSDHKSWGHLIGHKEKGGHKEKESNAEKDESSFAHWAVHTAKKLGNVVASKDLSDELSSKKSKP